MEPVVLVPQVTVGQMQVEEGVDSGHRQNLPSPHHRGLLNVFPTALETVERRYQAVD